LLSSSLLLLLLEESSASWCSIASAALVQTVLVSGCRLFVWTVFGLVVGSFAVLLLLLLLLALFIVS
jgi:hypothetical protein